MSRRCCNSSNGDMVWLVLLILALISMPIIGAVLTITGKEEQKVLGGFLLIVGIIIWFAIGMS